MELDNALKPVLAETLAERENVEIVWGDALKLDLCKLIDEKLAGLRLVVYANLPYNVTSPLLSAFIDTGRFDTITAMVQREVAHRLCAAPGTADYGSFTIYVNWMYSPGILFDVSPGCFMPAPKGDLQRHKARAPAKARVPGERRKADVRAHSRGVQSAPQNAEQRAVQRNAGRGQGEGRRSP